MVVRDGDNINQTLASIRYDQYGAKTHQSLTVCDEWINGFAQAKQAGYREILFVDSGTVFTDWLQWIRLLDEYPHHGLIGHIVWKKDLEQYPWLHPQCWYMEGDLIDMVDWEAETLSGPSPMTSQRHIHHDYTPLYIKPNLQQDCCHTVSHFGQNLIASQLLRRLPVVNWHQKMRAYKHYLYAKDSDQHRIWKKSQEAYMSMAENQFWILNNEPITIYPGVKQISPASGLHWMMNICDPGVQEMQLVDISGQQIDFARHLWQNWCGEDYGQQVVDFIKDRQLKHYELDRADIDKLQRLKFKNYSYLKTYVNDRFHEITGADFGQRWRHAQKNKTVTFHVENLVRWVLDHGISLTDSVWLSNILDYKWTLLNCTKAELSQLTRMVHRHD